jgi:Rrf2 family protein
VRISMKNDYALRAMMEMAASYGRGTLQSNEIAARRSIPESYLEQLLTVLRKAGYVNSVRGPQGGHSLAMHPSRISAADVVRALEGPLVTLECTSASDSCRSDPACALQDLWAEVRGAVEGVLEGVTIEDLAARQMARDGLATYSI